MFILRVWLERREIEGTTPKWRGVIEHVPSGERRYVKDLVEIRAFVVPYLEIMGAKPGNRQRLMD